MDDHVEEILSSYVEQTYLQTQSLYVNKYVRNTFVAFWKLPNHGIWSVYKKLCDTYIR